MNTNKSVKWTAIAVGILLGVVTLTAPGCTQAPGADLGEEYLAVTSVTQGSNSQPAFEVRSVGVRGKSYVMAIGFVLRVEDGSILDPVVEEVPEGCHSMYEDQPEERVLRIICPEGLEFSELLVINIGLSGNWVRLDLISLVAEGEFGNILINDLSANINPPFWNNPNL